MTAPALIALAHGSRDPRSVATITALTEAVACLRPDLRVAPAFLELAEPSFDQTIDGLVAEGYDEIVVVPLLLSKAYHATEDVPAVIADAEERHEGVRIRMTKVLGLEPAVFHVLDRRLREALAANRVRELDGLVLAGAGSSDPVANAAIARAARQWGKRHHLPTIAAFASQAPPAAGEAVRALRADGRRHIAVGLLFLAPGFLTDRVAELALEAGAVAVAKPLGAEREVAEVILARYSVGAVDLVDLDALFADA
jgi:sirohydrochlorin ferrochelatase